MKKLIVITVIFAVVLSAGIAETLFISHYFSALSSDLTEIGEVTANMPDKTTDEEVVKRLDAVVENWHKSETIFYLLGNNNILNNLFDRIVQARAYATGGQNVDATTCINAAAFFAKAISNDIRPVPINFI